jgi:hypothetical protein
MKTPAILVLAWLATLGGAWWLGGNSASTQDKPLSGDGAVLELQQENERLRNMLGMDEARLQGNPGGGSGEDNGDNKARADGTSASGKTPLLTLKQAEEAIEPSDTIDLDSVTDAADFFRKIRAYALAMFPKGKEGHLALLKVLDRLVQDKELQDRIGQTEREIIPHLYPMVKFLVNNDQQVVGFVDTVFDTMANDPKALEGFDDNTLEIFTEGMGPLLPSVVSESSMQRFRDYARIILETPEDQQSEAVRKNRSEMQRLQRYWDPEAAARKALEALQGGNLQPGQMAQMLRELGPALITKHNLWGNVASLLAAGDGNAMRLLRGATLDARTIDELDRGLLQGVDSGNLQLWSLNNYLSATNRRKWVQAQPLIETVLDRNSKAAEQLSYTLTNLPEKPPKEWVVWLIERHTMAEHTITRLKQQFQIE